MSEDFDPDGGRALAEHLRAAARRNRNYGLGLCAVVAVYFVAVISSGLQGSVILAGLVVSLLVMLMIHRSHLADQAEDRQETDRLLDEAIRRDTHE